MKDTTGAGDAFVAGLLVALVHGRSAEDATRFASVIASFVIEEEGCRNNLPLLVAAEKRYRREYGSYCLKSGKEE